MNQVKQTNQAIVQVGYLSLFTLTIYVLSAASAHAQVGYVLCAVFNLIYCDIGRGIATLAVAALGIGATMGKVSWGLAITVGVGIAVMFNADIIVYTLGMEPCPYQGC